MSLSWPTVFDPDETKDYFRDWTNELTSIGDTISTVSFVLPTSATDAGLSVESTDIDSTAMIAIVWFTSTDPDGVRAALVDTTVLVDHTITTSGGRTYNETIKLKVKEK